VAVDWVAAGTFFSHRWTQMKHGWGQTFSRKERREHIELAALLFVFSAFFVAKLPQTKNLKPSTQN
jgi:hypothetical protein